jgi:hypothetical protein
VAPLSTQPPQKSHTLLAVASLEELAQYRLGVNAKRHFLHLHRLEELRRLALRLFSRLLLRLALLLLGLLALLLRRLCRRRLRLDLGYLLLGCCSFFLSISRDSADGKNKR